MMKTTALFAALALMIASCGDGSNRSVLQNKGSDTLVNVAQAWAEQYREVNPEIAIAVTGGGSGTGISAMINGTVDIANSSRSIKKEEIELAEKNGQNPIEHTVGFDALAVYIHRNNPVKELSFEQLSAIYADGGTMTKWTDLGVEVPGCEDQEIIRISRQNNSGTYAYFRSSVLAGQDFKLGSRDLHGSKDVVDLVAHTPCAIGYSGLAYLIDEVKTVCVSGAEGGSCVTPSVETAVDRSYPIARPLFMYTNGAPTGAVKQYLDWIMSDDGQCIIQEKGYAPAKPVTCA